MKNIFKIFVLTITALLGCSDYERDNPNDYVNRGDSPDDGGSYTVVSGTWSLEYGQGSTISATEQNAGSNTVSSSINVSGIISKSEGDANAWASWLLSNNVISSQLKTVTSISFKVRGDGKTYQIQLPTRDIASNGSGFYYKTFATTNGSEQTVVVNINELQLPSWATYKPAFDRDQILGIHWQANVNDGIIGAFGPITISDIRIYSN